MAGLIGSHATVVSSGAERKKHYNITTTTTSLTGLQYTPTKVHVYHNGVRLVDGTDYTATDGTSITLTNAAENGDDVVVISNATFQTSDTVSASAGGTFSNDITINGLLDIDAGSSTGTHLDITTTGTGHNFDMVDSGGRARIRNVNGILRIGADHNNETADSALELQVDSATKIHIDSGGKVGIADTSPQAMLHINGSASSRPGIHLENFNSSEGDITFPTGEILQIGTWNTSTDTFNERMTIHNDGGVNFAVTNDFQIGRDQGGSTYDSGERHLYIWAGSSTDYTQVSGRNAADGSPLFRAFVSNVLRAEIEANGDFLSATNSYGGTSDQTLKENIVASGSQWDDIKAVQVKKFSYIADDLDEANMIGVIAQDLEASGMSGLVGSMEHDDGTTFKTVKYSVLYMKAIKALQEAMNRIETLETEMTSVKARLDALEAN